MKSKLFLTAAFIIILTAVSAQQSETAVKAMLNGLEFSIDSRSGSLIRLSYAGTGVMLQAHPDSAGIVDLAFPVKEFEPLRLASRFSENAEIIKDSDKVTIHWDELGASRSIRGYKGKVSATVILREEADGKSVSISCRIDNHSDHPIPQIIFPDFSGFLPFNGRAGTEFRTGGTVMKPFVDLVQNDHDNFYAINSGSRKFHYGFVLDGKNLAIKWMDIGGRQGGLSIFSKDWGVNGGYAEAVYLALSEISNKLRYMHSLNTEIAPDSSWQSAEFILTPHQNGWAEGIIPYRNWARQNIKRLYPLPDHVRDGLGFRTLWMRSTFYPLDPQGNYFTFKDLPEAAREAKEHGLDEMVLWGWYNQCFTLPLPPPSPFLGTEQDMVRSVAECRKIGVNVSPFISVMIAGPGTVSKYGLSPDAEYNFDPDFLPVLNPGYAVGQKGSAMVPSSNKRWQEEVLTSGKHLVESGISSLSWDQFFNVGPGKYLDTVVTKLRRIAKEKDAQSTFSGEAGTNLENECDYLDYTWNWDYNDGCDYRALISLLQGLGPRINLNIDRSAAEARIGFADNLYLNVYPRKPDGVNGSDYIFHHPKLSKTLKQCARLRKQFLDYFVNGTFIADCILSKDCSVAHISAYVLPKSILVIVINQNEQMEIPLQANISPWLKSATGRYQVKRYDDGVPVKAVARTGPQWNQKTPAMKNQDICLYEIIAE